VLTGHTDSVTSVAFRPVASLLASGSADRTVRLWNTRTGTKDGTLTGHTDGVTSVAFSPDGAIVASGSSDGTVRLWNPVTATPITTLTGHSGQVSAVAFGPGGTLLASGGRDGTIRLWDVPTGVPKGVLGTQGSGQPDGEYRLVFCQQGATLASISGDTLQLWDVASGTLTTTLRPNVPGNRFGALACSKDGTTLASGGAPVQLWDIAKRSARTLFPGPAWVTSVAFSPSAATLACGDHDNTVWLWALADGTPQVTLRGHTEKVRAVAYSHDGTLLASGSGDKTVRLWKI
jgi:WD40 repeat protein